MHAAPRKAARMRMEAGRATSGRKIQAERQTRWIVESGRKTKRNTRQLASVDQRDGGALKARYEALPQTPPGGKPPETPGPLSLEFDFMSQGEVVKGALRRQKAPPLTTSPCSGEVPVIRERGPGGRGFQLCTPPVGRPRRVAQNLKREKCT